MWRQLIAAKHTMDAQATHRIFRIGLHQVDERLHLWRQWPLDDTVRAAVLVEIRDPMTEDEAGIVSRRQHVSQCAARFVQTPRCLGWWLLKLVTVVIDANVKTLATCREL